MKNNFYSLLNRPLTIPTDQGSFEKPIYEERIVDGVRKLVVVGKENIKDFIEASREETLIANIMRKFELGDTSVLNRVQGFYGDVSSMPSNLAEAQNFLISLNKSFDSLSPDIKRKFDNSFDRFVKEVSSSNVETLLETFNFNIKDSSLASSEAAGSEVE